MRSWLGEFARACAVISAAALWAAPQGGQAAKPPLLVLLNGEAGRWRQTANAAGWQFLGTWTDLPEKNIDQRVKALEKRVREAVASQGADENRVFLAGQADSAALVFYVASRLPDLWAAGVAVGGSARPAIDTGRLFGANTINLPVLWVATDKDNQPEVERLKAAEVNVDVRGGQTTGADVVQWLSARRRDPFPLTADCETGVQIFPRCYWIEVTRFDSSERNDALPSTRVPPIGSGAYLDLGGFGYDRGAPGPGAVVTWLPEGYSGALKKDDRIVALGGKTVADGAAYAAVMDQTTEEKPVAVSVQRGKERLRLETRIVVPKREENITARVQGTFAPDTREIVVMSRAVGQMRLTIPQAWVPADMNWNGTELGKAENPGCWLLDEKNALLSARRCE